MEKVERGKTHEFGQADIRIGKKGKNLCRTQLIVNASG